MSTSDPWHLRQSTESCILYIALVTDYSMLNEHVTMGTK